MPLPPEFKSIDFRWDEPDNLQISLSFKEFEELWYITTADDLKFREVLRFITEREARAKGWPGPSLMAELRAKFMEEKLAADKLAAEKNTP